MNTKTLVLSMGLSLSGTMAMAQQVIVAGRVTSNAQVASQSRVQVQVKETKKRMSVTDQGLYVIEASKGQTLQFIYKGKVIKTFVVDSPQLDVALDLPEEQKDSLVSNAGAKDDVILRLEASKTVLDVNAPLAGDVVEYNKKAEEEPTVLNSADPKESWFVKLTNVDEAEFNKFVEYK